MRGSASSDDLVSQLPTAARLETAVGSVVSMVGEVVRVAYTDSKTELLNRRALDELAQGLPAQSVRYGVVFLDLTGFKSINDRHGYQAGDAALKLVAADLRSACASKKFPSVGGFPGAVPFRYGGDEFVVLVQAGACFDAFLAHRVRRLAWRDFRVPSEVLGAPGVQLAPFTCSKGCAEPDEDNGLETIVERASKAAKVSKFQRDELVRWTPDMPDAKANTYRARCTRCRTSMSLEIPSTATRPETMLCCVCGTQLL